MHLSRSGDVEVGEAGKLRQHWSINGRFLTQRVTGVQRYAEEIVRALDALLVSGHPLARALSVDLVVPSGPRRSLPLRAITTVERGRMKGHLWEQLALPVGLVGGLISLGNTGPVAVRRHILCIHDLNTRAFPQSYSRAFRGLQRVLLPVLGRTVAQVSTVSPYSAGEIIRHGLCDAAKVVVIPNGHEHVARWHPCHSDATRRAAAPNTIVIIGTPAPHKNVGLILGLADRPSVMGFKIAIVGGTDPKIFQAKRTATCGAAVTWLGKVGDAELAALLGSCFCLAFPSHVEGFGLPPLEAMALGCPVVVSDRACMPGICGDAALYASPLDAEAWLDCFSRLRASPSLRDHMIATGREQARLFSWMDSALLYLQAMNRIDTAWADCLLAPAMPRPPVRHMASPNLPPIGAIQRGPEQDA